VHDFEDKTLGKVVPVSGFAIFSHAAESPAHYGTQRQRATRERP
jgi:hypothetical protein